MPLYFCNDAYCFGIEPPMASRTQSLSEQDLRDLGFGSVVSRESHQRLLNRDGSFNVERRGLHFWSSFSLYHALLTMPWWQFLRCSALAGTCVANTLFALAYVACGPAALASTTPGIENNPFLRAFFFSVETLSTIGYGNIVPTGVAANVVVTIEALAGLAGFAIVTGLLVRAPFTADGEGAVQPARRHCALSGHPGVRVSRGQRALQRIDRGLRQRDAQPLRRRRRSADPPVLPVAAGA